MDLSAATAAGLDIPDGIVTTIRWWARADDNASNRSFTYADSAVAGNQPFTLNIDAVSTNMTDAFSGDWFDTDDSRIEGDRDGLPGSARNSSIRVVFDEDLSGAPLATDFLVSGFTVLSVAFHSSEASSLFLTVSGDLPANATPTVSLLGGVTDTALNAANTGDITAQDGIAPTPTLVVSTALSDDDVAITVTTDEDIRTSRPILQLFVDGDNDTATAAVQLVQTPTSIVQNGNNWVFDFTIAQRQTYSAFVTVQDRSPARNTGTAGEQDPADDDAITFEIDNLIAAAVTDPLDAASVPTADPFRIELTWTAEAGEYAGDSQNTVTLTKAVLDPGETNERVLTATTTDNITYRIAVSGIETSDHILAYTGDDVAGNTLDDEQITFTVTEPTQFALSLEAGFNLVSLPGDPADTDINAVFGDASAVTLIFTRPNPGLGDVAVNGFLFAERDSVTGQFETTNTILDLTKIDGQHAYWVEASTPVTVSISIPPLPARSIPPRVPVVGGEWNLVPVMSLLPVGAGAGQIQQGTELDADAYLGGNWTKAWTHDLGNWTQVLPGANPRCTFSADGTRTAAACGSTAVLAAVPSIVSSEALSVPSIIAAGGSFNITVAQAPIVAGSVSLDDPATLGGGAAACESLVAATGIIRCTSPVGVAAATAFTVSYVSAGTATNITADTATPATLGDAVQVGRGYWVLFSDDDRISP